MLWLKVLNTSGLNIRDIRGLAICKCKATIQSRTKCELKMNLPSEIEQQLGYINIVVLIVGSFLALLLGTVAYFLNKLLMGINAQIINFFDH